MPDPAPPTDARRVAIVTGGGTGIGAATARLFAENNVTVVLVGRRAEKLEEVAAQVAELGGRALALPRDLSLAETARDIVDSTIAEFGRLDVLVNNAATIKVVPFEEYGVTDIDEHLAVNIRTVILLIQAALPALRRSDSAAIVNISSSSASLFLPSQALYGMTKAALEYLTRSLAAELAPDRIRVNALALGPVDTPIHGVWSDDLEATYEYLLGMIPLGRMGTSEEVGDWIYRLADVSSSWLTGAIIPLDGGQTLG